MRECVLLSAAIFILATPRLWAGSATPFRLGPRGGVIVPVTLNEKGPFMMLLDTGASHSAITDDVAAAIGARAVAQARVITATGEMPRAIVAVDHFTIGPIDAGRILPSLVPPGSFDDDGKIQGLIGQDVLALLRYTLDFRRRTVEWHESAPTTAGTPLSLTFEHGRFLVKVSQGRATVRLVPDSGTDAFVVYEVEGKSPFNISETGRTAGLSVVNAAHPARLVRLSELRLGDRVLRNLTAVAIARNYLHPAEGDGLLPLHLFERVTFDGPARLMTVN